MMETSPTMLKAIEGVDAGAKRTADSRHSLAQRDYEQNPDYWFKFATGRVRQLKTTHERVRLLELSFKAAKKRGDEHRASMSHIGLSFERRNLAEDTTAKDMGSFLSGFAQAAE